MRHWCEHAHHGATEPGKRQMAIPRSQMAAGRRSKRAVDEPPAQMCAVHLDTGKHEPWPGLRGSWRRPCMCMRAPQARHTLCICPSITDGSEGCSNARTERRHERVNLRLQTVVGSRTCYFACNWGSRRRLHKRFRRINIPWLGPPPGRILHMDRPGSTHESMGLTYTHSCLCFFQAPWPL